MFLMLKMKTCQGEVWYASWAIGTLRGCQQSCLVCLFCGCVLNSVHLINVTFTFDHYNEVVMFVIHSIRFSCLSVCASSPGRSCGGAVPQIKVSRYGSFSHEHTNMWKPVGWNLKTLWAILGLYQGSCLTFCLHVLASGSLCCVLEHGVYKGLIHWGARWLGQFT